MMLVCPSLRLVKLCPGETLVRIRTIKAIVAPDTLRYVSLVRSELQFKKFNRYAGDTNMTTFLFPDGTERKLPTTYKSSAISTKKRAVETFGAKPVHKESLVKFQRHGSPQTSKNMRLYPAENIPINEARGILRKEVSRLRWEREVGGCSWKYTDHEGNTRDVPLDTSDRTQSKLAALEMYARKNTSNAYYPWKLRNGTFIYLDSADKVAELSARVLNHVEACFAHEANLNHQIDEAKSLDELRMLDIHSGWPHALNADEHDEPTDTEE